ncbi:hypothetical protein PMAYCL1PPCAC_16428, partial [Pristionchus mayeri]
IQMLPPRIIVPRKDFSTADPNRYHQVRCIVVMVSANDDEEALRALAQRPAQLRKYPLRLPSDMMKYPELERFMRLEDVNRREMQVQAEGGDGQSQALFNLEDDQDSLATYPMMEEEPLIPPKTPLKRVKEEPVDTSDGVGTSTVIKKKEIAATPMVRRIPKVIVLSDYSSEEEEEGDKPPISPEKKPVLARKRAPTPMRAASSDESEIDEKYKDVKKEADSDEDYYPNKKQRRMSRKTPSRARSIPRTTDRQVFQCVICSSNMTMKGSSRAYLTQHAMTHCSEKRYKCTKCPYSPALKANMTRHMAHTHKGLIDKPIDMKNEMRDELWMFWMNKCFPDAEKYMTPRVKKSTTRKTPCLVCKEDILADNRDRFAHIVNDHSDEKLDYDDPEGVKKRFFG